MLKIRFFRTGRKNQPFYRIVVTDSRNAPQGGKFIEKVGFFNPFTKEQELNEERIKYWLSSGAQPTDRVHNMLIEAKIIVGSKVDVLKKKITESAENPDKDKNLEESGPKEEVVQEVISEPEKDSSNNTDETEVNEGKKEEKKSEEDKKE